MSLCLASISTSFMRGLHTVKQRNCFINQTNMYKNGGMHNLHEFPNYVLLCTFHSHVITRLLLVRYAVFRGSLTPLCVLKSEVSP